MRLYRLLQMSSVTDDICNSTTVQRMIREKEADEGRREERRMKREGRDTDEERGKRHR